MIKNQFTRKTIAIFLTLNFLSTFLPYNSLYANNNGPNAPEAAAFEPVDISDMVNLATGDLTYGLPLLNVPSPEGGYPLSLSYHAGISADQEASWTGLGWNLNPGTINRSVNGHPDDWESANINEFFYDQGFVEDYYEFSIGGTLPTSGVTIGLGASWNSNKGFGGTVYYGYGGKNALTANLGYNPGKGISAGFNVTGLSFNASGQGFGVGVTGPLGLGSYTLTHDNESGKSSLGYSLNLGIMEVNFDSQNGVGVSGTIIGFDNQSSSITSNDYDLDIRKSGIDLDFFGLFWFRLGKTRVTYSLFKINDFAVSGAAYPYTTKLTNNTSGVVDENISMDVHSVDELYSNNTLLKPSYDSYMISAQGLSTEVSIRNYQDMFLFGKGNKEKDDNDDNNKEGYLTPSFTNINNYNLDTNSFLYDVNASNSFLRIDRTKLLKPSWVSSINESNALAFYTNDSGLYSQNFTPNGDKIKEGNRKRQGNYIETFTNNEILSNNTKTSFIEARGIDLADRNMENSDGIGAYKITTIDGKTYHYSLPVYNYEQIFKNFRDKDDENKNFYEIKKEKPYATHWLLTAVTGPDYIDSNNNVLC